MILSVSRRTDVPSYYSEWFYNRIKAGFACVRNPMNPRQVSRVELSPEAVECIVFWTKNPEPMLERLEELSAYHYYFQFTLTGYGRDVEANLPPKKERLIPVFRRLAALGSKRVIWRYDPIIFTQVYTPEYHLKAFRQIAEALNGCAERCVISFVDTYAKNRKELQNMGACDIGEDELTGFCRELAGTAGANGMTVGSCAEKIDLSHCGIAHNCCIDRRLIEEITGRKIRAGKDRNQRAECGCAASVDIGVYNTCRNGCKYCYANYSSESVRRNCSSYDPASPILCGRLTGEDRISDRSAR